MHYRMVLAAAVKFDHGDQQDDNGKYPTSSGIYPEKNSETIDRLETISTVFLSVTITLSVTCHWGLRDVQQGPLSPRHNGIGP